MRLPWGLAVRQADGCACLWGVTTGPAVSGRAPRIVQKLKAMIMAPSPYTNAVFCPPSASTKVANRQCSV